MSEPVIALGGPWTCRPGVTLEHKCTHGTGFRLYMRRPAGDGKWGVPEVQDSRHPCMYSLEILGEHGQFEEITKRRM